MINLTGRVLYYLVCILAFLGFCFLHTVLSFYQAPFMLFIALLAFEAIIFFGLAYYNQEIKKDLS